MNRNREADTLNDSQKKAVLDSSYPTYLQAGAGSGKTRVLVEKITHIIKTEPDISLENFAITTFTNKATDELAARLQTALYRSWISNLNAEYSDRLRSQIAICNMASTSTIHGFCEKLLRRHGAIIGIPNTFTIKSFKTEARGIVTKHVNAASQSSALQGITQFKIVDLVMELLQENSNKGLSISEQDAQLFCFDTLDNDYFNDFKQAFLRIYSRSETEIGQKKAKENIVTANDLIRLAASLFDNPLIAARVAKQYKYLFVDEFQDTNYEQFVFIGKIIDAGVNVFVIGDKKQSIYAFRGADVDNSDRIERLLKDTKQSSLKVNYRTDPALMSRINEIFSSTFSYGDGHISFPSQSLKSGVTDDLCAEPLRIEHGKSVVSIVRDISENVKIGAKQASYEDIAILCRHNADVDYLGRQLKAAGIPVEIMGGRGFYSNMEIIDTFKLLNAVIYKSGSTVFESRNTFYYRSLTLSDDTLSFEDFLTLLYSAFKVLSVEGILGFIYDKSHAIEYLRQKRQYQAVANLIKLKDKAAELTRSQMMKPLQFLEYLDVMITSGKDEEEAEVSEDDRKNGVVSLYSIHKAKGLEFPIVIVPNCDLALRRKTIFPKIIYEPTCMRIGIHSSLLGKDSEAVDKDYETLMNSRIKLSLEEELRIFYVACTRTQNMLVLASRRSAEQIMRDEKDSPSWMRWVMDA